MHRTSQEQSVCNLCTIYTHWKSSYGGWMDLYTCNYVLCTVFTFLSGISRCNEVIRRKIYIDILSSLLDFSMASLWLWDISLTFVDILLPTSQCNISHTVAHKKPSPGFYLLVFSKSLCDASFFFPYRVKRGRPPPLFVREKGSPRLCLPGHSTVMGNVAVLKAWNVPVRSLFVSLCL